MATIKVKDAAGKWVDAVAIGETNKVGPLTTAQIMSSGGGSTKHTLNLSKYIGVEDNTPFVLCWAFSYGSSSQVRQMITVCYDGNEIRYFQEGTSGLNNVVMGNGLSLTKGVLTIHFYSSVYPAPTYQHGSNATLIYVG